MKEIPVCEDCFEKQIEHEAIQPGGGMGCASHTSQVLV